MNVLVLGGGVIGAAIAYFLSLRGVAATIVERSSVGNAASGKSGGFIARDWCEGTPQDALARLSFDLHADLAANLAVDYGYRRLDTFAVAASERRSLGALRGRFESELPTSLAWVDGDCVPHQRLGTESTTAQVTPLPFTQALVDAAAERGAKLKEGAAKGLHFHAGTRRVAGVLVDDEILPADVVVIAMGPWSILAAAWCSLPGVFGLKGYSICLRPTTAVAAQALFLDYEDQSGERHGPELVPRPNGEIYLCGFSDDSPLPMQPEEVWVDEDACTRLAAVAGLVSTRLEDAQVVARQACYRPICNDAMPLLGPVADAEGVFVASGHNCWGMLNAPASGLAMSELIIDGAASCVDLTPFNPNRLPVARLGASSG